MDFVVGKQRMVDDNLDDYTDHKDEALDNLVGKEDVDDELDAQDEDGLEGLDQKFLGLTWNHHINKMCSANFLDICGLDKFVGWILVVEYFSAQLIETFGVSYQYYQLDSFLTFQVNFKGIKHFFWMENY